MMSYEPCNPNASDEVKNVLEYLSGISGKKIIAGQHTQSKNAEELFYIKDVTGKEPALCGFELLGYSPNIPDGIADSDCIDEIENNKGTLENVWDWAHRGGLITLTWHWFSPLGGHDKSFFACNTDFDAQKAITEGTPEYNALISDMDCMAEILAEFRDKKIPIIWRPFHECDGTWFWWGAKGTETAKRLYEIMFERYTQLYKLDNLIWVWNSADEKNYIGDGMCDIISLDTYLPERIYSDYKDEFERLKKITSADKIKALAEIGPIPSIDKIAENKIPWAWFMMWSRVFARTDKFTEKSEMRKMYQSDFTVTLDKLPRLY